MAANATTRTTTAVPAFRKSLSFFFFFFTGLPSESKRSGSCSLLPSGFSPASPWFCQLVLFVFCRWLCCFCFNCSSICLRRKSNGSCPPNGFWFIAFLLILYCALVLVTSSLDCLAVRYIIYHTIKWRDILLNLNTAFPEYMIKNLPVTDVNFSEQQKGRRLTHQRPSLYLLPIYHFHPYNNIFPVLS